jgi:hypothetical protein
MEDTKQGDTGESERELWVANKERVDLKDHR